MDEGGAQMATSSIFANVKITDPKKAEAFINALDASANSQKKSAKALAHTLVTDPGEIRKLMAKRAEHK